MSTEALQRLTEATTRLMESLSVDYSTIYGLDPRDLGIGDHPGFVPFGGTSAGLTWLNRRKRGDFIPAFLTEQQLSIYRRRIRGMVVNNEIALNAVNLHCAYAVGKGFTYEATPRHPKSDPGVIRAAQAIADAFVEYNELPLRESEILARVLVDGEAINRLFATSSPILALRWVEPEHVYSPHGDDGPTSFGVVTLPNDVESVTGYLIDEGLTGKPVEVPYCDVVHFKWFETPATSKRGLSAFYPIEGSLRAAEDLLYSTVSMAKARAKIAWIRKVAGMTADVAAALTAAQATATGTDPATQESVSMERYRYGTVLTTNTDIEMPSANIAASDHVAVMQMVLRIIAARFSMPEYMLSADASNGNYSSTLVAESPFVKSMDRLQDYLARLLGVNRYPGARQSLLWRQMHHAIKVGALPPEVARDVTFSVTGPTLTVRDVAKEAQVDKIYHEMRAKSIKTIRVEQGLDHDEEDANFKAEEATAPKPPMPLPGPPGAVPPQPGMPPRPPAAPPGASPTPTPRMEGADFDESKVTRDSDGKFSSGGGGSEGDHKTVTSKTHIGGDKVATPVGKIDVGTRADRMRAAAKRLGDAAWSKLDDEEKRIFATAYHVGHKILHAAETGLRVGKAIAVEAAKERGLSDEQSNRVEKVVGMVDTFLAWTVNVPAVTVATGNPLAGKAAGLMPLASMAYLAYSTARNPLATLRAAKKALGKKSTHEAKAPPGVSREGVEAFADGVKRAGDAGDWYTALVFAAFTGDLAEAVAAADEAFKSHEVPAVESSDWDESKHPRADDGKFSEGGRSSKDTKASKKGGDSSDITSKYGLKAKITTVSGSDDEVGAGYSVKGDIILRQDFLDRVAAHDPKDTAASYETRRSLASSVEADVANLAARVKLAKGDEKKKLQSQLRSQEELLDELKYASRTYVWEDGADAATRKLSVIAHEIGHAIDAEKEIDFPAAIRAVGGISRKDLLAVSVYGASHPSELFAEIVALRETGRYDEVPPPLRKAFELALSAAAVSTS